MKKEIMKNNHPRDSLLLDIYTMLYNMENRIKRIERETFLGNMGNIFEIMENHAKQCPEFKEFKITYDYIGYFFTIKCSCGKPEGQIISTTIPKDKKFLEECINEINTKYRTTDTPKPQITNPTDRMEV